MKTLSLRLRCHKSEKYAAPHLYRRCVCGPASDKTSLRNARFDRKESRASTPRQLNTGLLTIWAGSAVFSCHSGQGRINKVCWQRCFWQSRFAVLSGTAREPLLCSWSNFDLQGLSRTGKDELWQQGVTESPSAHIHSLTCSVRIVSYEWLQEIRGHWLLIDFIFPSWTRAAQRTRTVQGREERSQIHSECMYVHLSFFFPDLIFFTHTSIS